MPNFYPDTGGRRWSLFQVASSVALRGGTSAAFPIYAAQAPGCSIWSVPCTACSSSPRVFHKSTELAAPAFVPSQVRAAQAARSLTGAPSPLRGFPQLQFPPATVWCGVPSRLRVPSLSPHPLQPGACALCLAATLPGDVAHPESQEVF